MKNKSCNCGRATYFFALIVAVTACTQAPAEDSFTQVCAIITHSEREYVSENPAANTERPSVWKEVTQALPPEAAGRVAFEMAAQVSPAKKYDIYKLAAQEFLGREWSCPAWEARAEKFRRQEAMADEK